LREISRSEYEQQFGAAHQAAVDAVVGNYLAEQAFDNAYARLVTQGLSHEDAVRGAQQQLYGEVRSLSVGAQGPENRRAVNQYRSRQRSRAPVVPQVVPLSGGVPRMPTPAGNARMAGEVLAALLAGTGGLVGAGLESWGTQ
jgi:hypothetical protein